MNEPRFELTDELLQRYCDGELETGLRDKVEAALAGQPQQAAQLERYLRLRSLLRDYAARSRPDELTVRRNWEAVSRGISTPVRPFYRRRLPWFSAVAVAAAVAVMFLLPSRQAVSAEAEVESIDCTYSSFMVLSPDSEDTHTIVWVNDSGN